METIDRHTAAESCRVEHEILEHVKAALRVTLHWRAPAVGVDRKVSSVRFTLRSFQRHLERLMELEEEDGYLLAVGEMKPRLTERANLLRDEHDAFRTELASLVDDFDGLMDGMQNELEELCHDVDALLGRIDQHDRREIELLQAAAVLDEGGEG